MTTAEKTALTVHFAAEGAHRFDAGFKAAVMRIRNLGVPSSDLRAIADKATYSNGVEFGDVRSRHITSREVAAIREAASQQDAP